VLVCGMLAQESPDRGIQEIGSSEVRDACTHSSHYLRKLVSALVGVRRAKRVPTHNEGPAGKKTDAELSLQHLGSNEGLVKTTPGGCV